MHTNDLRQLAGRLMMIRLFGTELDAATADFIRANRIRGACLFRQNMTDAAQLTRFTGDLKDAMGDDALIALDQEGGAVVRALWVPPPPSAMALGAAGDAALARDVGAAVARACCWRRRRTCRRATSNSRSPRAPTSTRSSRSPRST